MKMTQDTLAALGACGPYVNTFRARFPETDERYADGVEMTTEVCESVYADFDWSWASEIILTPDANSEWNKLTRTRNKGMSDIRKDQDEARGRHDEAIKAWQVKHDRSYDYPTGSESSEARTEWDALQEAWSKLEQEFENRRGKLRATSFGQLAEVETNLSRRYHDAVRIGASQRYERRRQELALVERELENAQYGVRENKARVTRYQRELDRFAAQVPALEERLIRQRADFARFEVEHARAEAERTAKEAGLAAERAANAAKEARDRIAEVEAQANAAVQAAAELDAKKVETDAAAAATTTDVTTSA
jgi:chromosome segregation ATPase